MQVLYLVGILLMTFDLLTCGHSKEGNDCPSAYISNKVPILVLMVKRKNYVHYYNGTSLKWTPLGVKNFYP